ncbi:membrane-associated protein, putative [Bodo saltans]|uniref:Membrane-associated protein, putative n=1 Tax=Bodo saltans TaxID=75058 RepID=A0A0S4IH70_BODSA|nr:membrane-associated protein, putative [Bodo saltans]|eukprot:CUE60017.1 membrane-associated protein, putative [Bodo saltans]
MLWPTILTGFFFAITLVIVVIPSLYIADLDAHTVYQPSSANAIHADTTQTSPGIRQRIYLIFMIPAMAVANGLWVYLMYYRHVRNAFYRMEIGELENSRVSRAGKPVMKLLNRAAGSGTGDSTPAQQHANSSMISADTSYAFAASSSKHNILPPTSSSSIFPAVSSHHFPPLSREPFSCCVIASFPSTFPRALEFLAVCNVRVVSRSLICTCVAAELAWWHYVVAT